jgi:hypothetical protein
MRQSSSRMDIPEFDSYSLSQPQAYVITSQRNRANAVSKIIHYSCFLFKSGRFSIDVCSFFAVRAF